jgi:hypothetical protein
LPNLFRLTECRGISHQLDLRADVSGAHVHNAMEFQPVDVFRRKEVQIVRQPVFEIEQSQGASSRQEEAALSREERFQEVPLQRGMALT